MLRAIILIALVGHAAATAVTCVTDALDAYGQTAVACPDVASAEETECWTLVPSAANAPTERGCGGDTECNAAKTTTPGTCTTCNTDACNKKPEQMCWVGTVTDGVVDGATKACAAPADANCYSRSLNSDTTGATIDKGCGVCTAAATPLDYTCGTNANCATAADECNIPIQTCFTGTIAGDSAVSATCNPGTLTCFTRTKDDVASFGCGECKTADGYTCGAEANCKTITAKGCNEPPRFQCLQKDDWKVDDTTTVATDCAKLFTQTSCSKIVKDAGTINKACGACSAKAVKGETCYQCDETGCNSASGLFSVLALSMAVIYQLA